MEDDFPIWERFDVGVRKLTPTYMDWEIGLLSTPQEKKCREYQDNGRRLKMLDSVSIFMRRVFCGYTVKAVCFFIFLGGSMATMANDKTVKGVSSYTIYYLDTSERISLEKKSQEGDAAASFRLSQYYTFTDRNQEKELQYLEAAATQGHPIAQYNLAIAFSEKTGHYASWYNLDKAIYWAEKSAKNGREAAKEYLPELRKMKKKEDRSNK